jgi:hypothetical protein
MKYLLTRMAYSAREGYADFNKARNSLRNTSPLAMSRLTQRLIRSIRWEHVIKRRKENYAVMARLMDTINETHWAVGANDVPMCYPLTMKGRDMNITKNELAGKNVFTATYWPDALPRIKANTIEATLINETLFLPTDQRLEYAQIEAVGHLVLKLTGALAS